MGSEITHESSTPFQQLEEDILIHIYILHSPKALVITPCQEKSFLWDPEGPII